MKRKKKNKKEEKSVLNVLIPDHLKKINKNSGWCGTGTVSRKKKN